MGNFSIIHLYFLWDTCKHIPAVNRIIVRRVINIHHCSTHFHFYPFRSSFSNIDIVLLAHILFNIVVEVITCNTDRFIIYNSTEGNNSNFTSTSTNVNNHISCGLHHVNTNSDSCSHRLMDKFNFFGPGLLG